MRQTHKQDERWSDSSSSSVFKAFTPQLSSSPLLSLPLDDGVMMSAWRAAFLERRPPPGLRTSPARLRWFPSAFPAFPLVCRLAGADPGPAFVCLWPTAWRRLSGDFCANSLTNRFLSGWRVQPSCLRRWDGHNNQQVGTIISVHRLLAALSRSKTQKVGGQSAVLPELGPGFSSMNSSWLNMTGGSLIYRLLPGVNGLLITGNEPVNSP